MSRCFSWLGGRARPAAIRHRCSNALDDLSSPGGAAQASSQTIVHQTRVEPFSTKILLGTAGLSGFSSHSLNSETLKTKVKSRDIVFVQRQHLKTETFSFSSKESSTDLGMA